MAAPVVTKHKIAEFQLGNCIGKGAFGQVYKGINLDTGEVVAIKQVDLENVTGVELDSVMLEIELLAKLTHPNIVRYISFVKTPEKLNIILEFVEDGSLTRVIKKGTLPQEDVVARYTKQMLEGLDYLHQQGVVHCDIKCANILVSRSGVIKLTDFGVSRKLKNDEDVQSDVAGTPFWMAPEVIQLQGTSTASDIWSLGCTVLELLTGHPPYIEMQSMAALYRIVEDDHPPFPPGVSKDLEDFLLKIFQKDPKKRLTARQLLDHPFIQSAGRKKSSMAAAAPFLSDSTKRSKEDLKAAFDLLDPAGKGAISGADALTLLQALGCTWSAAEFAAAVKAEGLVGQPVGFDAFQRLFAKAPFAAAAALLEGFRGFDPVGQRLLPAQFLRQLLTQAGDRLTPEEFNTFLSEVLVGSDDKFDYEAFVAALCH